MTKFFLTSFAVSLLLSASMLNGESKNIADYTLRIRIFSKDATTFYYMRNVQESKGDGRADLFAGDDVHGMDFNYACDEKFKASFAFETYPAKCGQGHRVCPESGRYVGRASGAIQALDGEERLRSRAW